MKIQKLSMSTIACIALLSPYSYADEVELDPIVISSDFRSKTLSKTSNSVSVLAEDEISDKASSSFEDVIGAVPNVNFSTGASRAHFIQIRGIGDTVQFKTAVNPSVGLIVDGIDVSDSALALTMFDVSQIEVLKGPQGTTFGSNGVAGVVNVQSIEPTEETEGHIEATVGNYNTKAFGFAMGGSVIENKLLARISAYQNKSDGYTKNNYLNRDDTQNIDELTAKAHFKYLASDEHTVDFNFMHVNVDNGYDAFNFDNTRNTYSDEPGRDVLKTNAFAIKSTYQVNSKMHLVSKVSYSNSDTIYSYDDDWTYSGQYSNGYTGFDEYLRDIEKADIDLRLISDEDGRIFDNSTDWTIGVYYKNKNEDLTRNYTFLSSPYLSSFDTKNLATYGQLDSHLNDKFTLTTGLRVEKYEVKFSDSDSFYINTDEVLVGGKVGLSYQENEDDLYYITLSKGYKPGGVNSDNSLSTSARDYKTEHLWNLDLGKNFSALDGKLKNRLNLFYGLRRDQQVKSSVLITRSNSSTKFVEYTTNAAKSHYYGLESQMDYYPSDEFHLFASLGLLKAKFDEYIDPNTSSVDVNGRTPAQSPRYQYNVGFDHLVTSRIKLKVNVEGKDSYYFSNRHNEKSEAYALLNTSVSYQNDNNWTFTLWGKNITNESYETEGYYFGIDPSTSYADGLYTQQGAPRTFGLTVSYDF